MEKITLPTAPTTLPSNVDVREFVEGDKYIRVVMTLDTQERNGHFELRAQAWQMTADGDFVQAPNGFASRSDETGHTVPASGLGDTVMLDDAWCRYVPDHGAVNLDPVALGLTNVTERPTEPGTEYGALVWDTVANHAWRWTEGFADSTARAKATNLLNVLSTSNVRSGFGFR